MKLNYFGKNIEEGRKTPVAEIWYDENTEQEKSEIMFESLISMSWEGYGEQETLCFYLPCGKEDFEEFKTAYKAIKASLRRQ